MKYEHGTVQDDKWCAFITFAVKQWLQLATDLRFSTQRTQRPHMLKGDVYGKRKNLNLCHVTKFSLPSVSWSLLWPKKKSNLTSFLSIKLFLSCSYMPIFYVKKLSTRNWLFQWAWLLNYLYDIPFWVVFLVMCWTLIVEYNSNVNYWVSLKFGIRPWRGTLSRGGGGGREGLF